MQGTILGLLAETHIHPGAGQSEGAVDLPVAREKTTDYPFVPGSGVKGAMRDLAERRFDDGTVERIYGRPDGAGELLLSDAKLLLLPVRCLSRCYLWLTCPYLIERYQRDRQRVTGEARKQFDFPALSDGDPPAILCAGTDGEKLFLEERLFARKGETPDGVAKLIAPLFGNSPARQRLVEQLALASNADFAWFTRYALPVHAHNLLDENKTSKNLWYEETVAPDTLFYTLALFRNGSAAQHLDTLFFENGGRPYLQLGGNETTGQGWFHVAKVTS